MIGSLTARIFAIFWLTLALVLMLVLMLPKLDSRQMTELLESGFADSFRTLYPDLTGAYSWWSYRSNARANNTGWRIDYFVVSRRLMEKVKDAFIEDTVMGSDHCPVGLELDITA